MRFRPCIDIHNGRVKQIVGGSLCDYRDEVKSSCADENFVSLINARSKRSYIAIYAQGNCLLKEQILPNEKVLEIIKEYHEKGFKIYGNTTYLNIPNDGQKIIEGLLTFANITKVEEDILSLKPIYLKDTL